MKVHCCAASLVLGLHTVALAQDLTYKTVTPQIKRFVAEVLSGADKRAFTRWKWAPTLHVESNVPELKAFAEATFADLIQETKLEAAPASDVPAEPRVLTVLIGVSKELQRHDLLRATSQRVTDKYGSYRWWDKEMYVNKAMMFVSTDRVSRGAKDPVLAAKDVILKTMLGTFGFIGRSDAIKESCFMGENQTLRQAMTPVDRMLVGFAYKHVPPGTASATVWRVMTVNWGK